MNSNIFVILASGIGFLTLCGTGCSGHSESVLATIDPAQCTVDILWIGNQDRPFPRVIMFSETSKPTPYDFYIFEPFTTYVPLSITEMKNVLRLFPNLTEKPRPTGMDDYFVVMKSQDRTFVSVLRDDRTTLTILQEIADILPEEKRQPIEHIISRI